ncbi:MAG: hypothetical protein HFJ30_09190 [Clostridia bacterium]|nr:hypothetical protein [Clostridia bacterium]
MEMKQIIEGLKDLIGDRESFIIGKPDHDEIFKKDKNILQEAINLIQRQDKMIDKMLDMLTRVHSEDPKVEFIANANIEEKKEQAKQYFEKQV